MDIMPYFWYTGGGGLVTKLSLTLKTPWTGARQAPLSMGFPRQEYGVGCHFLLQGISQPRDRTQASCIGRQILYHRATRKDGYQRPK